MGRSSMDPSTSFQLLSRSRDLPAAWRFALRRPWWPRGYGWECGSNGTRRNRRSQIAPGWFYYGYYHSGWMVCHIPSTPSDNTNNKTILARSGMSASGWVHRTYTLEHFPETTTVGAEPNDTPLASLGIGIVAERTSMGPYKSAPPAPTRKNCSEPRNPSKSNTNI